MHGNFQTTESLILWLLLSPLSCPRGCRLDALQKAPVVSQPSFLSLELSVTIIVPDSQLHPGHMLRRILVLLNSQFIAREQYSVWRGNISLTNVRGEETSLSQTVSILFVQQEVKRLNVYWGAYMEKCGHVGVGMSLLKDMCHWGWDLKFQNQKPMPYPETRSPPVDQGIKLWATDSAPFLSASLHPTMIMIIIQQPSETVSKPIK